MFSQASPSGFPALPRFLQSLELRLLAGGHEGEKAGVCWESLIYAHFPGPFSWCKLNRAAGEGVRDFFFFFLFLISEQSRWLLCDSEKLFIHFCTLSLPCSVLSSSSVAVGGELRLRFFLERLFCSLYYQKQKLEVPS